MPSRVISLFLLVIPFLRGDTVSPLTARGYTVLPIPQKVSLGSRDFALTDGWQLVLERGVQTGDIAGRSLNELLNERCGLSLSEKGASRAGVVRLTVTPSAVAIGDASDRDRDALAEQAYRLVLKPGEISVTANAAPGLFYGVQTLVQLLKPHRGRWMLPEGEITDWPDLGLRIIYWDDAHHLEPLPILKHAVRQAAFYKINGFSIKLEGHFQYKHAAPLVEPYAFSPAELQELNDYALEYHVQVIPYLDGPAHIAFILKHPEYAALREYPESNYEACVTNPQTYKLFEGMFQDLLDANKGGKYFVLSTDEPYYVGLAKNDQCNEADAAKEKGSVGKLLADFVTKTAGYLHDRGRIVIFWGEYPMKPDDIAAVPRYMVNGEVYGPEFDPVFKAHGVRQLIFTSTVGWKELLFSNYYWETVASDARPPIWGDWDRINHPPQPAEDQTLPLPPLPAVAALALPYDWTALSERRLQLAGRFLADNDELFDLLHRNLQQVEFNHYNMELYLAIAQLYRQNIDMLLDLARINAALRAAQTAAAKADGKHAVAALDRALDIAENIRQERNQAYADAAATWYKSWYPRVAEGNGRKFLDKVDDVKDHLPVRTVDMTYLIYRQLLYPLGDWAGKLETVRNQYAAGQGLPAVTRQWDWKDTTVTVRAPRASEGDNN
jgi:hypothetical protein